MSFKHRRRRNREEARSLAISLGIHVAILLVLSWLVVSNVRQPEILLSMTAAGSRGGEVLVSMPHQEHRSPRYANSETLIDIDPLQHGPSFASISANHLRPRFERKSVEFFGTHAYGSRFVYILDRSPIR